MTAAGIAFLENHDLSGFDVIKRADKALGWAKQAGRNHVCMARGQDIRILFSESEISTSTKNITS